MMRLLVALTSPNLLLISVGVFGILASSAERVGSWRAVFVPMYLCDLCWLFALHLQWKRQRQRGATRRQLLQPAVFLVALLGKLLFDVLLPLRLDAKIQVDYVFACLPLVVALVVLAAYVALETRRAVSGLA